jgi:UDP-glucose 4-epimerase
MNIVVFGGSGFLGSHVSDKLSEAGHKVTIFDRDESAWLRSDQSFIKGDILDLEQVKSVVSKAEVVYNFAGIADIDDAKDLPLKTIQLNILGNAHILEACKEENIKRYVFASSVYVYSQSGSFYRASKKASEDYIEQYNERYGLNYTILRYGTLYGPRSNNKNAIYRFVKSALDKGEISYSGDLEARRDYIHVHDAALASVEILDKKYESQSITLTGYQSYYVKEMLEMIKEILGNKVKISLSDKKKTAHYKLTPYTFTPKFGMKYIPGLQVDLGQGLLGVVEELHALKEESN